LKLSKYVKARQIYPACFRLVYGCGLREMEVLSLKITDVNFTEKTVHIQTSKNGESRLLPMSDSLVNVLIQYARRYRLSAKPEEYFFAHPDGKPCSSDSLYKAFRFLIFNAQIPHRGKGKGPRVHDLRCHRHNKSTHFGRRKFPM
jgi:integrase